jgi:DNA polymerase elongation subunit (family B)
MELKFIPLDYDSFDWRGRNYIKIAGRDDKGKRVVVIDSFEPYFWAILKKGTSDKKIKELQKKMQKINFEGSDRTTWIEKTEVHEKNFLGQKVKAIKIFITNYKDAHAIADRLDFEEIEYRREYDLGMITRYIIDKGINPLSWFKVTGEVLNNSQELGGIDSSLDASICLRVEKFEPITKETFSPKIIAFDIEADELEIGRGEVLMISIVGKDVKKVLTWKQVKESKGVPDFVEYYKDEADMLEAFSEQIKKLEPDLLVGYFSDGFDLPYLRARADKNHVKLDLGIDGKNPFFARGKYTSARIFGPVHVDIFRFIETVYSQYLHSETLGLDEVASELLGENKIEFEHKHSSKIDGEGWIEYFKYNLQDSVLTYKLAEKLWPDMLEFSKVIQEPLFDVTRAGMSQLLEHYILHNLRAYDEIAEKRPIHDEIELRRGRERVEGAFVFQPIPGLYENLAMFDFTSMHTSIIVSFNISKATLQESGGKDTYESPEVDWQGKKTQFYFSKKTGFLPEIVKKLIEKRKDYKKEYKQNPNPLTRARSNAFKVLSAAVHGYIGFFGARYYSLESSASILAFVRKYNKDIIDKVNAEGYSVIYADTDSVAFTLNNKGKKQTLEFLKKLNEDLPGIMELELEDFYVRGIWVTKRTGELGAKKKYALLGENGKLKIRGFETVRRDWCALSRELQDDVLDMILKEGKPEKALKKVQEVIDKLKKRKISKEKLIIKTQLKKPIEEYKSISPHVTIAKRMHELGMPIDVGRLIEFYIAEPQSSSKKKSLIRDRAKLPDEPGEYDLAYYLDHQLLPAIENIFQVFKISKEDILGKKQMNLSEF